MVSMSGHSTGTQLMTIFAIMTFEVEAHESARTLHEGSRDTDSHCQCHPERNRKILAWLHGDLRQVQDDMK
jgi:hypothetical protein